MAATRKQHSRKRAATRKQAPPQPKAAAVLYVAFELSWNEMEAGVRDKTARQSASEERRRP